MNKDQIKETFLKVFPNSHISVQTGILGSKALYVSCRLFKSDEWSNKIAQNDPLQYMFDIEPDGLYTESSLNFKIKPTQQYMYCANAKLRKKTIKAITADKLEKRFNEVKQFILSNKSEWFDDEKDLIQSKLD
jgi:hypothetical protein